MSDPLYIKDFSAFHDLLRTSFTQSRRFSLVERHKMDQMLKEQSLGETGLVNTETAKRLGSAVGADYIIYGTVMESVLSGRTRGPDKEFRISVETGILDADTGEIKTAGKVEVVEFGSLQQVMRVAAEKLTAKIIMDIYPLMIAHADQKEAMLNYGDEFLSNGQIYQVFAKGSVITDPATGAVLAYQETPVGKVRVTQTTGKFSKAEIIQSEQAFEPGMICRPIVESVASPTSSHSSADLPGSPDATLSRGRPKLVIGDFIYSREFNLEQNADRSTSVVTVKPSGTDRGSTLGAVAGAAAGAIFGKSPGAAVAGGAGGAIAGDQLDRRDSVDTPGINQREQYATQAARKSEVLREMVVTRAVKIGQFEVIERSRMDEIKGELNMTDDGSFDAKSMAERGRLIGADYLAFGTITKFSKDQHHTGQGFVGGKNTVFLDMTVDLRIIDVKTGSIKIADTVSSTVETTKETSGFLGFGTAREQGGALGDLLTSMADDVIAKITTTLRPITVIDVDIAEGVVMINYGEGVVERGSVLAIYAQGNEIKDPYTGQVIGFRETEIGTIRVQDVQPRWSKCIVVHNVAEVAANIKLGMVCRPKLGSVTNYRDEKSGRPIRTRDTPKSSSRPAF